MKRKLILIGGIILLVTSILILLLMPRNTKKIQGLALSGINITCDKNDIKINETTTCYINAVISSGAVTSFTGNLSLSNNLALVSSKFSSSWSQDFSSAENGKYMLSISRNKVEGNMNVGSFVIRAVNDEENEAHITMQNVVIGDEEFNDVAFTNGYKTIRVSKTVPVVTTTTVKENTTTVNNENNNKPVVNNTNVNDGNDNRELVATTTSIKEATTTRNSPSIFAKKADASNIDTQEVNNGLSKSDKVQIIIAAVLATILTTILIFIIIKRNKKNKIG